MARMLRGDPATDGSDSASSNDESKVNRISYNGSMIRDSSKDKLSKVTMEESIDLSDESKCASTDESEGETAEVVEDSVAQDMEIFAQTFKAIQNQYRLISRIGEGEFKSRITNIKVLKSR